MRKNILTFLFLCALALLVSTSANGQTLTQVSATITDPNGLRYSNALVTITLAGGGPAPQTTPCAFSPCFVQNPPQIQADASGKFSIALYANASITPGGTTWCFYVNEPGIPLPGGTGPQSFSSCQTIAGASQDLSATLSTLATALAQPVSPGVPGTQFGSYLFWLTTGNCFAGPIVQTGTLVCLRNNNTGAITSGADAIPLIQSAIAASATTGALLNFKLGRYPANTATLEAATGCSNFQGSGNALAYEIGFPARSPFSSAVQWTVRGEAGGVWQGEAESVASNTAGTYLDVTAAALASVPANSVIAGVWQSPVTDCTFSASNVSNDVTVQDFGVRFPANTRGNEIAVAPYFTDTIDYEGKVIADFAQPNNSIATGAAPAVGSYNSIGIASSVSSSGNWQHFHNTYVTGFNLCYDLQSEHDTDEEMTGIYCNQFMEIGRSGTAISHPIVLHKLLDQENKCGLLLGPQMAQGTLLNIDGYDFELGTANWYARTTGCFSETNQGYTSGTISYTNVTQGVGITSLPASGIFTSGGQNIQLFDSARAPNISLSAASDTFTHPNAASLGPAWFHPAYAGTIGITSNVAGPATAASGSNIFVAQPVAGSQFSSIQVSAVDAAGGVGVTTMQSSSAQTYYEYFCGGSGVGRLVLKTVAGTPATLGSTASAAAVGDTCELDAIVNPSGTVTLIALHDGTLDSSITGNPFTDASAELVTGQPGIIINSTAGVGADSVTNWTGGALHPVISTTAGAITGYSK